MLRIGYLGSGKLLKKAIKKYGIENFTREVLFEFDTIDELKRKESEVVDFDFIKRDTNYNLALRWSGLAGIESMDYHLKEDNIRMNQKRKYDLRDKGKVQSPLMGNSELLQVT